MLFVLLCGHGCRGSRGTTRTFYERRYNSSHENPVNFGHSASQPAQTALLSVPYNQIWTHVCKISLGLGIEEINSRHRSPTRLDLGENSKQPIHAQLRKSCRGKNEFYFCFIFLSRQIISSILMMKTTGAPPGCRCRNIFLSFFPENGGVPDRTGRMR